MQNVQKSNTSRTSARSIIVASVVASMFMVAIEVTIVSTAMPQVVADLGDLHLYGWAFSSFLLSQTTMTVIFGKLADLYGRRLMILIGIAVFLVGSIAAGFASTMQVLIASRVIQGIGAGAVQPVAMTIIGDLYPGNERAKVQGYLASMWAISAILGPIVGSLIVQHVSWSWIFWINVPVGCAAAWGFAVFLKEEIISTTKRIDVVGAALFASLMSLLIVGLMQIENNNYMAVVILSAIFLVVFALFLFQERRTPEPIVSLALWGMRPIAVCNITTALANMALMGLTAFLPMYVQGVLQGTSAEAGLTLTVMLVGWPLGSILATRIFPSLGLRFTLVSGGLIIPLGGIVFIFDDIHHALFLAFGSFLMGFGMGLSSISALVAVQSAVDYRHRGSVTASNVFSRNLGSTLGATVLGAVLDYGLVHNMRHRSITSADLRNIIEKNSPHGLDLAAVEVLRHALHMTFCVMFIIAVVLSAVTWFLPHTHATIKDYNLDEVA